MLNLYVVYGFLLFVLLLNIFNYFKTYNRLSREENFLYAYLLLSIFGWFVCNVVADISKNIELATFAARLAIIFPLHLANAIFQITRIFPQRFGQHLRQIIFSLSNILAFLVTLSFLLVLETSQNISNIVVTVGNPIHYTPGTLYFVVFVLVVVFFIMIGISWTRNFKNYTRMQKRQIWIFLIMLGVFTLSTITGLILLPSQGIYDYGPGIFLSLSLLLFVTNQNLLTKGFMPDVYYDVGIMTWGLLSSGFATYYIFVITQYDGALTAFSVYLLTLALTVTLLASYKKVANVLRSDYYGIEDEVLKFASRTTVILDKEKIIQELYLTLGIIFPNTNCKVVLEEENNSNLFKKLKVWWSSFKNPMILTQEIFIEQFLLKKVDEGLTKELYDKFREENIELTIPLKIGNSLGGMIVMKNLSRVLGVKEHEILNLLAENASLAMSRAMLHEEVEEYSRSLESKVSEQTKELRQSLQNMEEMRQREKDLVDMMGHELRTPLTIVKNSLELVEIYKKNKRKKKKEIVWDGNFQKQFEHIKAAVRREMGIVETLLSATKLDAKKIEPHFSEVDLLKVIDTTLLGFEKEAAKKGLKVKIDIDKSKKWVVIVDSLQLQQVVDNIVSNAVKYTPKGHVKISLKDLGSKISVIVSDTGEGMDKASVGRLGQKFHRVNHTNGNGDKSKALVRPGGTGLGLFVAFGLVKVNGGTHDVQSQVGKGSTFTVTFKKP